MPYGFTTKTPMPAESFTTPPTCAIAERARTEALRDLGVPHAELVERFGVMFMVRGLEVDYCARRAPG